MVAGKYDLRSSNKDCFLKAPEMFNFPISEGYDQVQQNSEVQKEQPNIKMTNDVNNQKVSRPNSSATRNAPMPN